MTLTDSVVSGNQAAGELTGQADGGGIADESSARLTLIRSAVTGNTASAAPNGRFADGGGIYVDHDGTLTVQHSVIDGNTASLTSRYPASVGDSHAGTGGVDVQSGGTATIDHTSISGNRVSVTDPERRTSRVRPRHLRVRLRRYADPHRQQGQRQPPRRERQD